MKPKINKFGLEIEAEMSTELMNKLGDYGKIVSDGSLRCCSLADTRKYHNPNPRKKLDIMEFVSNPIDYNENGRKQVKEIFRLFDKYFKEKEFHWNRSMGFHVHISFRPKTPVDIWSVEFANLFVIKLTKRFPSVFRTRKDNSYCKIIIDEKEMANMNLEANSSERYRFINFVPAWKKHKTIEFRIFPMNKPRIMKQYLGFTFRIINDFLKHSDEFLKKSLEFSVPKKEKPRGYEFEDKVSKRKRKSDISELVNDKKEELNLE